MKRRAVLAALGGVLLVMLVLGNTGNAADTRPNILVIMTDQQFADGMSCVLGRQYLHTPNMDALAENGVRFTRAYAPNPLCMPMRTSMMTGLYPHQTGVQTNSKTELPPTGHELGHIFNNAGYKTAYFGKWQVAIEGQGGFDTFVGREAEMHPEYAAEFLKQEHDRPFLAVASFLSPHEICQWSRRQSLPGAELGPVPPLEELPPLRENAEPPAGETDIMTHMRKSYQAYTRLFPVGDYTEHDWRRLIWGYYRLIERVDGYVGVVMTALRESGQEENTVVVFLSDHGDCHGAHRWNQKTVFYDESARVPFIISQKGRTRKGESDVLVNTGVDMIPTLCDFAGIEPPSHLPGRSVKAPALGKAMETPREFVVTQNRMVQCAEVDGKRLRPHGRMVRSERYKYCLYSEGKRRESLVDMAADSGEMVNLADNPEYHGILLKHRDYLRKHAIEHEDETALQMLSEAAGGNESIAGRAHP